MNKIQKFIKENGLGLNDYGSGFNSTCAIIAGYALYLNGDTDDVEQVLEDIQEDGFCDLTSSQIYEFEKVFDYAYRNNYAYFWDKEESHSQYIFEQIEDE